MPQGYDHRQSKFFRSSKGMNLAGYFDCVSKTRSRGFRPLADVFKKDFVQHMRAFCSCLKDALIGLTFISLSSSSSPILFSIYPIRMKKYTRFTGPVSSANYNVTNITTPKATVRAWNLNRNKKLHKNTKLKLISNKTADDERKDLLGTKKGKMRPKTFIPQQVRKFDVFIRIR